jgi:hypothetical protein
MVDRKFVPFDEFYYQLNLTHVFQKHPVYIFILFIQGISRDIMSPSELKMQPTIHYLILLN